MLPILLRQMNDAIGTEPSPAARPCPVMILVTGTHRRGAEVFGEQLAESLQQNGWRCDLVALSETGGDTSISSTVLFDGEDRANLGGLNLRVVRRLRSYLNSRQPSVVLAGGGATLKYSVAAMIGMRNRPTLIYSSIGEPEYWATSPLRRRLLTALLNRSDLITAVSHATADQLVRSFGVAVDKVRVAPTGVPDRFLEMARSTRSAELRVLFIGNLSPEKNPLGALEAISQMDEPSLLRFVGDGPMMVEIREKTTSSEGVEVVGSVADVGPHLEWADVLVLTSLTEGLPGVALEASASGTPVVAFDVGGISEIVEHDKTGVLVSPGDVAAMASELDRISRDAALLDSMSDASRETVRHQFRMSHSVARYQSVLEEACRRE